MLGVLNVSVEVHWRQMFVSDSVAVIPLVICPLANLAEVAAGVHLVGVDEVPAILSHAIPPSCRDERKVAVALNVLAYDIKAVVCKGQLCGTNKSMNGTHTDVILLELLGSMVMLLVVVLVQCLAKHVYAVQSVKYVEAGDVTSLALLSIWISVILLIVWTPGFASLTVVNKEVSICLRLALITHGGSTVHHSRLISLFHARSMAFVGVPV